ncbi:S9 family peptidase [Phycisphaerales bacterium]|nr:S9 family peptidase [Phycisphaerales bacterium]
MNSTSEPDLRSAIGQSAVRAILAFGDFHDVADCGCHDNRMDKIWWNELWMGWPIGEHYAEPPNVTNAHRLEGELMLVLGGLDRNVDPRLDASGRRCDAQGGQELRVRPVMPSSRPRRRRERLRSPTRRLDFRQRKLID